MNKRKIYIQKHNIVLLLLLLLFSGVNIHAQQTITVGDTTQLSVNEVQNGTYVWELYDRAGGVNFANIQGNCPENKAVFVGSKNNASAAIRWLVAGTYFYKITINDGCSNNFKIGKITVTDESVPPPPEIAVVYDCVNGTAILEAFKFEGELVWSTGQTSKLIEVTKQGEYSVLQIVNGKKSLVATVNINNPKAPNPPIAFVKPNTIEKNEEAVLIAEECKNGTLHWYSDKQLTTEVKITTVKPTKTTVYYATCKNNNGCESKPSKVTVTVGTCVKIYNEFSPNGDGINDYFKIECLDKYPGNVLKIYNRWGNMVYQAINYKNTFKGLSNGRSNFKGYQGLPEGTYFYTLNLNDGSEIIKGWLQISR